MSIPCCQVDVLMPDYLIPQWRLWSSTVASIRGSLTLSFGPSTGAENCGRKVRVGFFSIVRVRGESWSLSRTRVRAWEFVSCRMSSQPDAQLDF